VPGSFKKSNINRCTAPYTAGAATTFQITHPFHPFFGRHFRLVSSRLNWQQEWIYFHDDNDRLASVPTDWASLPQSPSRDRRVITTVL
jgi:hypothetical protein